MPYILRPWNEAERAKWGEPFPMACACMGTQYPALTKLCPCALNMAKMVVVEVDERGFESPRQQLACILRAKPSDDIA